MAAIHATRALALVGTPFRAQGRDPCHGLDCIGLCLIAFDLPAEMARDDYRLRGDHDGELRAAISTRFRRLRPAIAMAGDMMVMAPADDQLHLGILTSHGFVHADARLRSVVETPGRPTWKVTGLYRLRRRTMA